MEQLAVDSMIQMGGWSKMASRPRGEGDIYLVCDEFGTRAILENFRPSGTDLKIYARILLIFPGGPEGGKRCSRPILWMPLGKVCWVPSAGDRYKVGDSLPVPA